MTVTPWWRAVRLRDEVVAGGGRVGDAQMSLYRAVHGAAGQYPPYAKADYFGRITHPSPSLARLMADVAVRLAGAADGPAFWRLDQAMGGGKSHALIGLWHLARDPAALTATDIGRDSLTLAAATAGRPLPDDLDRPQTVVLSCDNMTPGASDPEIDGPAGTLHERFLWRLFGGDRNLYDRYRDRPDKARLAEALRAVGRPVLILVDEVLDYVRQLSRNPEDSAERRPQVPAARLADLAVADMAFLRFLFDAVDDVDRVAAVVVMIEGSRDTSALDTAGQARRAELEDLLVRNALTATVTASRDFADILRRRLFDGPPPAEVVAATVEAYRAAASARWRDRVLDHVDGWADGRLADEVVRCYPFHPSLLALAETDWARVSGFQRVRSTIRIFAATAYELARRGEGGGWAPPLIGPGDLPLSAASVRESVLSSGLIVDAVAQANYRGIAATDIVSDDDAGGSARLLDLADDRARAPWAASNPRAAERAATALFLYSVMGGRAGGRQGATEAEAAAATFVPDLAYTPADAEDVLAVLRDPDRGLATLEVIPGRGGQPPRLYLTTRQTANMLYRAARSSVSDDDRDQAMADAAQRLAASGPFRDLRFVAAPPDPHGGPGLTDLLFAAGLDDARSTRLAVLDPRRFSLLNGVDAETGAAMEAVLGVTGVGAARWGSSLVFAVVNTQRRRNARAAATEWLARVRVAGMDDVRGDPALAEEANREATAAKQRHEEAVRAAYQHIAYLDEAPGGGRQMRTSRFEHESALNGAVVWRELVALGKALDQGQFDRHALLHNLDDGDYGRPLGEVRDLFWTSPRRPLLHGGEADLRAALYDAVRAGEVRIDSADGTEAEVTSPGDIGIGSSSLRLARPAAEAAEHTDDGLAVTAPGEGTADSTATLASQPPADPYAVGRTAVAEAQVRVGLNTGLSDDDRRTAVVRLLQRLADLADDASHVGATVTAVVPVAQADGLRALAEDAGATFSSSPVD